MLKLHLEQGRKAFRRGRYRDAARHAKAARAALPGSIAALEFSGDVELRRRNRGRAAKHFEAALARSALSRRSRRRIRRKLRRAQRRRR